MLRTQFWEHSLCNHGYVSILLITGTETQLINSAERFLYQANMTYDRKARKSSKEISWVYSIQNNIYLIKYKKERKQTRNNSWSAIFKGKIRIALKNKT